MRVPGRLPDVSMCACVCSTVYDRILWCGDGIGEAAMLHTVARICEARMKNKVREKRENLIEKFERTNLWLLNLLSERVKMMWTGMGIWVWVGRNWSRPGEQGTCASARALKKIVIQRTNVLLPHFYSCFIWKWIFGSASASAFARFEWNNAFGQTVILDSQTRHWLTGRKWDRHTTASNILYETTSAIDRSIRKRWFNEIWRA